jgi:hypothetical protein
VLLSPAHRPGDHRRGSAATHRAGASIVIAFLLFAIRTVIFWLVALVIAIKATAATAIAAKMLHDHVRDSQSRPGNY